MVKKVINHFGDWVNYPESNKLYEAGIKPGLDIDKDQDGIVDWEDCDPFDVNKQGLWSSAKKYAKKAKSYVGSIGGKIQGNNYGTGTQIGGDTYTATGPATTTTGNGSSGGSSGGSTPPTIVVGNSSGGGSSGGGSGGSANVVDTYIKSYNVNNNYTGGTLATNVLKNYMGNNAPVDFATGGPLGTPITTAEGYKNALKRSQDYIDLEKENVIKEQERIEDFKGGLLESGAQTNIRYYKDADTGHEMKHEVIINNKKERVFIVTDLVTGVKTTRTFEAVKGISGKTFESGGIVEQGAKEDVAKITPPPKMISAAVTGEFVTPSTTDLTVTELENLKRKSMVSKTIQSFKNYFNMGETEWQGGHIYKDTKDVGARALYSTADTIDFLVDKRIQADTILIKTGLKIVGVDGVSDKTIEENLRKNYAKTTEIAGSAIASGLGFVGLVGSAPSGGATVGLIAGGAAVKTFTGFVGDIIRTDNNLNYEKVKKDMYYNAYTGALQAVPIAKIAPVASASVGQKAVAYGVAGYSNWESVSPLLYESGLSVPAREWTERYETNKFKVVSDKGISLETGIGAVAGAGIGAAGKILFPKTKQEVVMDLSIGKFLGADYRILKPAQNVAMYGGFPILGGKQILEAESPSDYVLAGLAFTPLTLKGVDNVTIKLGRLKQELVVPGIPKADIKGARVTVIQQVRMEDGSIKQLVQLKKTGQTESVGGGITDKINLQDVTEKDILKTAVTETMEETGLKFKESDYIFLDVINGPLEVQFVVKNKKIVDVKDLPALGKDAAKEGIVGQAFIGDMGTAGSLYDNIYTSKVYEGNKLWANIKKKLEIEPSAVPGGRNEINIRADITNKESEISFAKQGDASKIEINKLQKELDKLNVELIKKSPVSLRQSDVLAFRRAKGIENYNKLSEKALRNLEAKGQKYFDKTGMSKKIERQQTQDIFSLDIGKEFYLMKKGLGEKQLFAKTPEFGWKIKMERQVTNKGKKTINRLKKQFKGLSVSDEIRLRENANQFFMNTFGPDYVTKMKSKNIDLGLRYYKLQRGIGTKLEVTRLKLAAKTQISPSQAMSMEILSYAGGREAAVKRDVKGRFTQNIAQSRVNPELEIAISAHSRYRGNPKKIAKFISNQAYTGTSFSPTQMKSTKYLVDKGFAEKFGFEISNNGLFMNKNGNTFPIDDVTFIVLDKTQKKLLFGIEPRGENVIYFTPPTTPGITGRPVGSASYADIGGIDSYGGTRFLFGGEKLGIVARGSVLEKADVESLGFTRRGSPFGKKQVSEIELGILPSDVTGKMAALQKTGVSAKVKAINLRLEKYNIINSKLNEIDSSLVNLNQRIENLKIETNNALDIKSKKNIVKELQATEKRFNQMVNLKKKEVYKMARQSAEGVSEKGRRTTVIKEITRKYQIPKYKQITPYTTSKYRTQSYRPSGYKTSTYKVPTYTTPTYTTPTYRIPTYPTGYKTPTYVTPKYKTPTYKTGYGGDYDITKIKEPPIEPKPVLQFKAKTKREEKKSYGPGWNVYSKPVGQNKFSIVNTDPVSEKRAKDIGAYYVSTTLARTFQIRKSGKVAKEDFQFQFIPEGFFNSIRGQLRDYKIKKGKGYNFQQQYIQKSKFMLGSAQEKRQIQSFRKQQKTFQNKMKKTVKGIVS